MSTGQEWNNRSQGQRLRRLEEKVDRAQGAQNEINAQNARDHKVTKSRVSSLEENTSQLGRLMGFRSTKR